MDTIKIEGKKTKMIAHRGVSGLERENTYPAFVAAGNRSYYGIETDIQVTDAGDFIAIHDETTERVSLGANNINVIESSIDDIRKILLPDIDGNTERLDIRIPTLADYVNICKKYGKKCILEVKNVFTVDDIKRMVDEIKKLDYLENVIFISIEYENCVNLRALLPDAEIQYLARDKMDDEVLQKLISIGVDAGIDIDYDNRARNKERIDILHAHGIKVNLCVCDDAELAKELIDFGADFITSNILE